MLRKLDPAKGHNSWCWPKGAWPLWTTMVAEGYAVREDVKEVQEDDNEIELNMLVIVMKITMRTSLSFEDLKIV